MRKQAKDLVWLEGSTGERTSIEQSCVIGRSKECQVVVKDTRASRRHAMIHRQGLAEYWLVDLGSANGTKLNGRRVSRPSRVSDGDKVELAGRVFTFRQLGQPGAIAVGQASTVTATDAEIRQFDCWLLVADIVGSTEMVRRLESETAVNLTGRWLERCKQIIEGARGTINKFLGDGFFAYWPEAPEAAAAVTAGLQALKRLQEEAEPAFRLVLHFGAATSGGAPSLGEESLGGKDITFVFRMEDLASSLGTRVLVSEAAVLRLGTLVKAVEAGAHTVSGFEGEYFFYTV